MSLKLTTSLSQRLVLTPQLRQRIEMLQMTSLELTDLIQQQLLENPVLEEVPSQEEVQELAEKVLDHMASSDSESTFEQQVPEAGTPATNGSGDAEVLASLPAAADGNGDIGEVGEAIAPGEHEEGGATKAPPKTRSAMLLKRSISDANSRTISIPVTRLRKSSTKKMLPPSNNS